MVHKYIIDKADIHDLLTGKEIPLEQGSKVRAFCVEIAGGMTNGEVIQALFPNSKFTKMGYGNIEFAVDGFVFELTDRWLNAPYKAEKPETCKGCLEPCIMYEPDMRGCKKKVRERGE